MYYVLKVYISNDLNNGHSLSKQSITMVIFDVTMEANRGRHISESKPLTDQIWNLEMSNSTPSSRAPGIDAYLILARCTIIYVLKWPVVKWSAIK